MDCPFKFKPQFTSQERKPCEWGECENTNQSFCLPCGRELCREHLKPVVLTGAGHGERVWWCPHCAENQFTHRYSYIDKLMDEHVHV